MSQRYLRPVTRRLLLPGAALLAAALLVTGCRTNPGAAAVVGGSTISNTTLRDVVDRALSNPVAQQQVGNNKVQFEQQELTRLILHQLITKTAAQLDVTVSDGEVNVRLKQYATQAGSLETLYEQAEQNGIPRADLLAYVRDLVLQDKISDALLAKNPVSTTDLMAVYQQNIAQYNQVHSAHILVRTKALADQILAQVKAHPNLFAALAKRYSIDTASKPNGGDLGFAGPNDFVQPFAADIFKAKPGSFIEVHTQFGWHVVHVIAHRQTTFAQAEPSLRSNAQSSKRQQLLGAALANTAKKEGVSINPRYGQWDSKQETVAPLRDNLSSPEKTSPAPGPTATAVPGGG